MTRLAAAITMVLFIFIVLAVGFGLAFDAARMTPRGRAIASAITFCLAAGAVLAWTILFFLPQAAPFSAPEQVFFYVIATIGACLYGFNTSAIFR